MVQGVLRIVLGIYRTMRLFMVTYKSVQRTIMVVVAISNLRFSYAMRMIKKVMFMKTDQLVSRCGVLNPEK